MTQISAETPTHPYARWLVLVLGAILAARLVSLGFNTTALYFDEAQYWLWGKEPALGYFSKPPLLGWIIAGTTAVCGSDSEFCVRLASPFLHTVTAVLLYFIASDLFDRRTGFWTAVIFVTLPGISLSSSLISTDVPLLACWAGALWALIRFERTGLTRWAVLLGVFVGLGLMAKYAMIYFVACAALYALAHPPARPRLASRPMALAGLIALVLVAPNLWWNIENQFITASHTAENIGWGGRWFFPDRAANFVVSQFGVFGPILFAIYCIALFRFWREGLDGRQKLLVWFSLPMLVLITMQGLVSRALANWAAVSYVAGTVLLADILINRIPVVWHRLSLAIHGAIAVVLAVAVAYSAPGVLTLPGGTEPFHRLHGWRDIAAETSTELDREPYVAVIGGFRQVTAELTYYMRERDEPVFALPPVAGPRDHYELTRPYDGLPAGPVLLVSADAQVDGLERWFAEVEQVGSTPIAAGGIDTIWFFRLDGFKAGAND